MPIYESYKDTKFIDNPSQARYFYGDLDGFPHTYAFTLDKTEIVFVQIQLPDLEDIQNNRGVIVVKKVEHAGVEEVTRLQPKEATWETYYDYWGGDRYREGVEFSQELSAGDYLVEVSTPINEGKYVLSVGNQSSWSIRTFAHNFLVMHQVKSFFEKPIIFVLLSVYYWPIVLLLLYLSYLGRKQYLKTVPTNDTG